MIKITIIPHSTQCTLPIYSLITFLDCWNIKALPRIPRVLQRNEVGVILSSSLLKQTGYCSFVEYYARTDEVDNKNRHLNCYF